MRSAQPEVSQAQEAIESRLRRAAVLSNLTGALVAFAFLVFVVPVGPFGDDATTELIVRNGILFTIYMASTLIIGTRIARRRTAPIRAWLAEGRGPTDKERRRVLREPLSTSLWAGVFWVGAAAIFAAFNIREAVGLSVAGAVVILLGGLTTCAVNYLIAERVLRPVTARALAGGVPERRFALGVRARLTMAWALGTGVPLIGLAGIAVFALVDSSLDGVAVAGPALFLSAVALLTGFLAARMSARSVGDPLTQVRSALSRVEKGDLDVEVPVDDGSEIGFLEAGFNQMAAGLREREKLHQAFGAFVDPELTERVLREGVDLGGEEVEVSVLFMDVRDFTAYAERASAEEVVSTLNELFDAVVPVIARHGGHANKFIGDGLLAVFGAPQRLPDHAERAVAAALEIAELVRERFAGRLSVGVGVNSGTVVAGTVGGGGRLDFTVIGDAVNTAARVEAATRETGDDVLITDTTLARLPDRDGWVERPPVELKGKSRPVPLYAPDAAAPATAAGAALLRKESPG